MKKSRIRLIVILLSIILLVAILALVLAPPSASFEKNKGVSNISTVTTDKEYSIKVELPDVKEEDIQVTLKDDTLIIKAEKKKEKEEKNESVFQVESFYGSFQYLLHLPEDIDQHNFKTFFKNTTLTISLPRKTIKGEETK
jgi:HSP20 family protein